MFFYSTEEKSEKMGKKLKELLLRIEKIDRDIEVFLHEQCIDSQEVVTRMNNRGNFTSKEVEEIEAAGKILNETLGINLSNIIDPRKTKKTYKERVVQPHWIYVR